MTSSGIFASSSICCGSTRSVRNARKRLRKSSPSLDALGVDLGLRVDEAEVEVAEVHPAAEAGLLPLGLAAGLGDLLGLFV